MPMGYHLRFLKMDEAAHSIDGADIVRVEPFEAGTDTFGVQLHAHTATLTAPLHDEIVLHLQRDRDESEGEFLKRAFRAAAEHNQHATAD